MLPEVSSSSGPTESRKRKREGPPDIRELRVRQVPPEHQALQSEVLELLDVEPSKLGARLQEALWKWHLSVEELERLVFPGFWGLDQVFPNRRDFLHYIFPTKTALEAIGGINGRTSSRSIFSSLSCTGSQSSMCKACATFSKRVMGMIGGICFKGEFVGSFGRSARWVECLNGLVYVRLMTDPMPTELASSGSAERVGTAVLPALRTLPLDPALYWAFPQRVQSRIRFLSWVGSQVAMNPIWTSQVLKFLSVEDVPQDEAHFKGPLELHPWR